MNHHKIKLILTISGIFLEAFLYSHSAYAASYINVSSGSGGAVSFGSIKPTSTGTSATASDTLTVHTDCSVGYSVYVSGQNGKDTNLTNKTASSDNVISTSSTAVGDTATALNSNTWGLNHEDNGTYVGLPEYSETLPPALVTISNASETSTVDIYYGLKVNTALTPGTYTGDILYTVLSNSACSMYTVRFNANGGTGSMDNQAINVGVATALSANTFTKTGYTFLGWSTNASATTPTYVDKETVTDITDFNTTIDLYAIWAPNTLAIAYSANGGTGAASKTSETAYYGTNITMPTKNTLARSGYDFLGWSLSSTATSATWTAGQININPTAINSNLSSKTGLSTTVYAVWKKVVAYMQNFTCSSSGLTVGQQVTLVDSRDNHEYTVKKLPDGKCWMTQNLTLGDSNSTAAQRTLTSASTNINNGTTYYLPPAGKQGSITSSGTLTSATAADFSSSNDNLAKTQFRTKNTSYANDSDTGYYNFYTATLGYSYDGDSISSGSSTRDICPKGWRLPWTSNAGHTRTTTADFYVLANSYNTNASWTNKPTGSSTGNPYASDTTIRNGMYLGAAANGNNYAGFSYSGYWGGVETSASTHGSNGYYWSSSVFESSIGYALDFHSLYVIPQNFDAMFLGHAVRCIAKS